MRISTDEPPRRIDLINRRSTASATTVSQPCCSSASTTPAAPRWPSAFLRHYAGDNAVGWSGGSEPGDQVSPVAIEVMAERGIDISGEYPKPWTDEVVQAADVVITMGCVEACPVFPGKRYEEWALSDPAGFHPEGVRPVRDEIEQMVIAVLEELDVPVPRTC